MLKSQEYEQQVEGEAHYPYFWLFTGFRRRFTFARIDISCERFLFYESAIKVLSYARLNCAVFNYFYMSLGQVRHTIVVSRYQNHRKHNEIQP